MTITNILWFLLSLSVCLVSATIALYAIVRLLAYIVSGGRSSDQ